jgi:CRISPR-associated endonuclease/helicase Cas3
VDVSLGQVLHALLGRDDLGDSREVRIAFPFDPRLVPQSRDLSNLFDTTPDLSGADIDIAPFIRDGEDLDVLVFWRDDDSGLGATQMWKSGPRAGCPFKKLLPTRDELCPVAAWRFRKFFGALKPEARERIWVRDWRKGWIKLTNPDRIYPGQLILLHKNVGGYDPLEGWNGDAASIPEPCRPPAITHADELDESVSVGDSSLDDEENAVDAWRSVYEHSIDVATELGIILSDTAIAGGLATADLVKPLGFVPPWHDVGKAQSKFPAKLKQEAREQWAMLQKGDHPAKAPQAAWKSFFRDEEDAGEADHAFVRRRGFRHELASALALLETLRLACPNHAALALDEELRRALDPVDVPFAINHEARSALGPIANLDRLRFNLVLYLVVCHHGKVRLGLRSTEDDYDPGQRDPIPGGVNGKPIRRCQGVQDGDGVRACRVPSPDAPTDLAQAVMTPALLLSLDPMELCSARYGASWADRTRELLETYGPFCIGYLEALVRAADQRASAAAGRVLATGLEGA